MTQKIESEPVSFYNPWTVLGAFCIKKNEPKEVVPDNIPKKKNPIQSPTPLAQTY